MVVHREAAGKRRIWDYVSALFAGEYTTTLLVRVAVSKKDFLARKLKYYFLVMVFSAVFKMYFKL